MAGISPIQAGDYVDIGLDDIISRYVVLAEGLSPTQIYISPVNNVSDRHKLVYINGEWKVKHGEHINYNITFHHKHQGHYTPNYSGASVSPPFRLSSASDPSSGEVGTTKYRPLTRRLEQLSEGKYINVDYLTEYRVGTISLPKKERMKQIIIPGLDIGAITLQQYGLALEFLVEEEYIRIGEAMDYYGQFMDVGGVEGDQKNDLLEQFYERLLRKFGFPDVGSPGKR
jgi:hypothetical protein